jgi:hypothetical protein
MSQKSGTPKMSSERIVKDIRRATGLRPAEMEIEKWRAETGARGRFAPESLEWLLAQDRVDDILTDDLVAGSDYVGCKMRTSAGRAPEQWAGICVLLFA